MPVSPTPPHEASLWSTPIRDLGLTIEGTRLEPILAEFEGELLALGLRYLRPRFYLSTEWGVPFDTVAVAIPFYLAHPELTAIHAEHAGHVEGMGRSDILRYLRHEMGHVVNYAYRLYQEEEWARTFGPITLPYREEYRPRPFSRRYVRHLPGWYAQKHPDEDWSETFAVWMTPEHDWRTEYAGWPAALAKLEYCDRRVRELRDIPPLVVAQDLDEDVTEIGYTLEEMYRRQRQPEPPLPLGLDGALRTAVVLPAEPALPAEAAGLSAAALLRRLEPDLAAGIYQWTGHFPERTRRLVRHLVERADRMALAYPAAEEPRVILALTALITALAMNYVREGSYLT